MGQDKAAAADFTRAISHSTEPRADHFLERAQAQAISGDVNGAIQGLDEGLKRMGPLVALQLYAIELECARKHFDDALARLEKISTVSERKEKWLVRRGEILLQANRRDEAKTSFAEALTAIESLPLRQRSAPAMVELEKGVKGALRVGL